MDFDLSTYVIIGPENTRGRPFGDVLREIIAGGATFIQIRGKESDARELCSLVEIANDVLNCAPVRQTRMVLNDRLDVVKYLRDHDVHVDGIHVGQNDLPASFCREVLGPSAIIGLTAPISTPVLRPVEQVNIANDYFGLGPLHATSTKPNAGLVDGVQHIRTLDEIKDFVECSPVPVVVGGGVKAEDIPAVKATGADGVFVISAITEADDPRAATSRIRNAWINS